MTTTPDPTLILWRRILPRVEQAISNSSTFLDGYPTGANAGSGDGSRTEALACAHVDHGDHHGQLRRRLERQIVALADLVDALAPSSAALAHVASKADQGDGPPAGWCESCWRDNHHHSPTKNPGGSLCRWCGDAARHLDLPMPPLPLVRKHNRGQRITDRDLRR